jgi:hypothetical protein
MKTLIGCLILCASAICNATTINLPDPAVAVNLANNVTTVTVYQLDDLGARIYDGSAKTYRGASQFVYFSECVKPDSTYYHCNINTESDVVLVASDGSTAVVNITAQFSSTLIRSGHNWWRQSKIVLAGDVTVQ